MTLDSPSSADPGVRAMVEEAVAATRARRGGAALLAALDLSDDPAGELCARGALRVRREAGRPVGLAVVHEGALVAVYVEPARRRTGLGRSIARAVLEEPGGPRDAWALPGDRATKSLYESLGLKARLLTMRAE